MTDAELDALEAAAKAATPGPWEDLSNHPDHLRGAVNKGEKHIALCGYLDTWEEERRVTLKEMLANAAYIAAANPDAILELVQELKQAKNYISELEEDSRVYAKRIGEISKLLDIEHDAGSLVELSYIFHSVERLQEKLRQTRAERDWLAEVLSDACKSNSSCPFTFWACIIEGDNCLETRLTNWLQAAKEATCQK